MPDQVTVADVARLAGVSTATVSRAMSGAARVAPSTLTRVKEAAAALRFHPSPAARSLRQGRTRSVALVLPSLTNPFFPELVAGIHTELRHHGYSLLLSDTEETGLESVRLSHTRMVDGILMVGSGADGALGDPNPNIPIVAIDRAGRSLDVPVIQGANEDGAGSIVEHLVEMGHERIAHIAGPTGLLVADQRRRGYEQALEHLELAYDPKLVVNGNFSEESGLTATGRLLEWPSEFTAIFAANDMMAIGAMAALRRRGLQVPEDVAVAGYDGIQLGRYVQPTLTTYAQPLQQMIHRGVELLIEGIVAGATDWNTPRVERFRGEVVVRESSLPATRRQA